MKKTLIALAALTAASASFAQATISGEFAYGYYTGTTPDNTNTTASGFGIDTSLLNISANEDLGGGMSVKAAMSLSTAAGNGNAVGDAQSLTLTTPVGALSLLTYKPGDWATGAAGGATWYGLDGKVLGARSWRDAVAFTMPVSSALSVSAAYLEPSNVIGEGTGTDGTTGQSLWNVGAKYTVGGLVAQGAYLAYNAAGATAATTSSVTRLGASYDMGVAKVGVGVQMGKSGDGTTNTQTALSASAPLGANLSVNGTFASNNTVSNSAFTAGLAGTRTGYMLGLQYNLSKRTYAILNGATWTGASAASTTSAGTNHTSTSSMSALTLVHDF